ncbi:MAG: hypothetical protein ABRQ38_23715 [Candidatus Eremiobacterota bacterium]
MKKILFLLLVFIMILPALGQDAMKVTVNGRDINYILFNNEPYIPYSEISVFGFKEDYFKTVPYETVKGEKYYQLKGCCNLMGLVSAENYGGELKITLNLCESDFSIKSNDIELYKPVKISIYNQDGTCVKELGMYGDRVYKVFLPPGQYLVKSQRYELFTGGDNNKITTNWGYENTYAKSPGLYVGQTYPYPYPYQYNYPCQNYPYPTGPCPSPGCPSPTYPNQTYILLSPTETSVKSSGNGYIMQADESKKQIFYYWERQIEIKGEKMDVEINDSSLHYL